MIEPEELRRQNELQQRDVELQRLARDFAEKAEVQSLFYKPVAMEIVLICLTAFLAAVLTFFGFSWAPCLRPCLCCSFPWNWPSH